MDLRSENLGPAENKDNTIGYSFMALVIWALYLYVLCARIKRFNANMLLYIYKS